MAKQIINSIQKVAVRGFYVGIRKSVASNLFPFRSIFAMRSDKNNQSQSYLALSDNDKKYNDWNKVENDLRKVIQNCGQ